MVSALRRDVVQTVERVVIGAHEISSIDSPRSAGTVVRHVVLMIVHSCCAVSTWARCSAMQSPRRRPGAVPSVYCMSLSARDCSGLSGKVRSLSRAAPRRRAAGSTRASRAK